MTDEFKETLNKIVGKIGQALENASTLTVETWYLTFDEDEGAAGAAAQVDFEVKKKPLAKTEIKVDGDCYSVLPMRKGDDGKLQVDDKLLNLHDNNVQTARQYRSDIMSTFLGLISR